MPVRIAAEHDVESLFAIRVSVQENHQSREELAVIGVTPGTVAEALRTSSRAWIFNGDGVDAGFCMANADDATIFALFVRPEFEGQGICRRLLAEAEAWLFDLGAAEIWLTTGGDAELRANGFYRHLGWTATYTLADGQTKYLKYAPPA